MKEDGQVFYDSPHGRLEEIKEVADMDEDRLHNWISINLPEDCPNVCISFKREIAEAQIKDFGAKTLYGFEDKKDERLPVEIFITYGGLLAPDQQLLEI